MTPDTAPEIDANAPEPDAVVDDLDTDASVAVEPDDPADYEAAAAEMAADAEPEPSLLDGLDPKLANHIQKLRREAADKRVALAELDEQLQAAGSEIAELQEWKEQRMRRDVESLAAGHKLIAPAEIWHHTSLPEVLDADGEISEDTVAEIVETKVPAHWRVQTKYPARNGFASGATGLAEPRPASWQSALARPLE
jgi:hypothetical protein